MQQGKPVEHHVTDSKDPNRYVREGFADDVIKTIVEAKDGDAISVGSYEDALRVRIAKNAMRPQLQVDCHVRNAPTSKFGL